MNIKNEKSIFIVLKRFWHDFIARKPLLIETAAIYKFVLNCNNLSIFD